MAPIEIAMKKACRMKSARRFRQRDNDSFTHATLGIRFPEIVGGDSSGDFLRHKEGFPVFDASFATCSDELHRWDACRLAPTNRVGFVAPRGRFEGRGSALPVPFEVDRPAAEIDLAVVSLADMANDINLSIHNSVEGPPSADKKRRQIIGMNRQSPAIQRDISARPRYLGVHATR